jgi:hypothetical protein
VPRENYFNAKVFFTFGRKHTFDTEFDNETLGILPGTYRTNFLAYAVNRTTQSIKNYMVRKRWRNDRFLGLVRTKDVTQRLTDAWQNMYDYDNNIPTVEELLWEFLAGKDLKITFLHAPNHYPNYKTEPIPYEHLPESGIRAMVSNRVSMEHKLKPGESLEDQTSFNNVHMNRHCVAEEHVIPAIGVPCFNEICSGWGDTPQALLRILNDPKYSACDPETGECIAVNLIYFRESNRVIRDLNVFRKIRDALSERKINLWAIQERKGSLTHKDKFEELIAIGEEFSKILSMKIRVSAQKNGLKNCGEAEPTCPGDPWCPRENTRLRDFMDKTSIPSEYQGSKGRQWKKLAAAEFPHRTGIELERRVKSIRRNSGEKVERRWNLKGLKLR